MVAVLFNSSVSSLLSFGSLWFMSLCPFLLSCQIYECKLVCIIPLLSCDNISFVIAILMICVFFLLNCVKLASFLIFVRNKTHQKSTCFWFHWFFFCYFPVFNVINFCTYPYYFPFLYALSLFCFSFLSFFM